MVCTNCVSVFYKNSTSMNTSDLEGNCKGPSLCFKYRFVENEGAKYNCLEYPCNDCTKYSKMCV